jgi:coenzyme Q-binding protein COQ10
MPFHQEIRTVPYQPQVLFDIVADVGRYPEFLPWCVGARVGGQMVEPDGTIVEMDELMVGFKAFRERYTSEVRLNKSALTIEAAHIRGPFRHLYSKWRFVPCQGGTEIHFSIDFEFRNPVLRLVANAAFGEAASRMVRAFEGRAAILSAQAALPKT